MNEIFLHFCFLDDFLSYIFLLDASILTFFFWFWWWGRRKKSIKSIFERFYLNLRKKNCKFINTGLSISWILKKLNSIQTLVEEIHEIKLLTGLFWAKPSEIHIWYLELSLSWTNFVFYPNICHVPHRILSYRESTVAGPMSPLAIAIYRI